MNLINKVTPSDSFAQHFATQFKEKEKEKSTVKQICNFTKVEILWQGNLISCSKSFGKMSFKLCMKERLEILKASGKNKKDELTHIMSSSVRADTNQNCRGTQTHTTKC